MFLERLIIFIVLGFFIFVADLGSWWQTRSLGEWYGNYIIWIGLIAISYLASNHKDISDK